MRLGREQCGLAIPGEPTLYNVALALRCAQVSERGELVPSPARRARAEQWIPT